MATLDVSGGPRSSWQPTAKPEQQLQAMIEISHNLSNALTAKDILPKVLDSLFKIFVQADRGFVIMRPKPGAPLVPVATKARRGDDDDMRISRTIVKRAIDEKKAILSADAASDARFNMAQSIADFHIRSLICAPMIDSNGEAHRRHPDRHARPAQPVHRLRPAGAGRRGRPGGHRAGQRDDARAGRAAAGACSATWKSPARCRPRCCPRRRRACRATTSSSTTRRRTKWAATTTTTCCCPDDRFAAVVGDVAGKGVSAAILMAKLSSDVRFWLAREPDPAKAHGQDQRRVFAATAGTTAS